METPQAYAPENVQWRAMPNYDYETETYVAPEYTYVAPVQIETLHLPVAVTPTAPIIAPRNKVRFGDAMFEQANWMSDVDAERTNNTSAILEAQATDFWRSVGVETTRAERLAASQVAGGVTGAVAGATAVGVPAAVVGGLIGGTVGGVQGAALDTIVPTPIPGLPVVTSGVAGTAGGAAIGAAVAGVPAAAVGGLAGGAARCRRRDELRCPLTSRARGGRGRGRRARRDRRSGGATLTKWRTPARSVRPPPTRCRTPSSSPRRSSTSRFATSSLPSLAARRSSSRSTPR